MERTARLVMAIRVVRYAQLDRAGLHLRISNLPLMESNQLLALLFSNAKVK